MMANQTEQQVARTQHWSTYAATKAENIDRIYKTDIKSHVVRNAMTDAVATVAPAGSAILDVGCGTGDVSVALHDMGYRVTGTDISAGMLSVLKRNAEGRQIAILEGDIFQLSPPEEKFDVATARYVFSHYVDFGRLLTRVAAFVKPGGHIIFDSFSTDAIKNVARFTGFGSNKLARNLYSGLAHFDHASLIEVCDQQGLRIVSRHPSSLFHRNPIFAFSSENVDLYDAELGQHLEKKDVMDFIDWLKTKVDGECCSYFTGAILNVVQKLPA